MFNTAPHKHTHEAENFGRSELDAERAFAVRNVHSILMRRMYLEDPFPGNREIAAENGIFRDTGSSECNYLVGRSRNGPLAH